MQNRTHTHCPTCGEHYKAVGKTVETGAGTWICERCDKRKRTVSKVTNVLIPCPDCTGVRDDAIPCAACGGLGSVYVAQSEI